MDQERLFLLWQLGQLAEHVRMAWRRVALDRHLCLVQALPRVAAMPARVASALGPA